MKSIFKYSINSMFEHHIFMPHGAQILTLQMQNDNPNIWALVDTSKGLEEKIFHVYPTGGVNMPDLPGSYVGTFQYQDGTVWHVFEQKEE